MAKKRKLERDVKKIFRILAEGQKKPEREKLKKAVRNFSYRDLNVADAK